jgi:hypothetical protein
MMEEEKCTTSILLLCVTYQPLTMHIVNRCLCNGWNGDHTPVGGDFSLLTIQLLTTAPPLLTRWLLPTLLLLMSWRPIITWTLVRGLARVLTAPESMKNSGDIPPQSNTTISKGARTGPGGCSHVEKYGPQLCFLKENNSFTWNVPCMK